MNEIGLQGAKHLANALAQNQVTPLVLLYIEPFIHYFLQTLTTLVLFGNEIGAQGAEHLANALQQNRVTSFAVFYTFHSVLISHRN